MKSRDAISKRAMAAFRKCRRSKTATDEIHVLCIGCVADAIRKAVAEERERCAEIADDEDCHDGDFTAKRIAKKIRAGSKGREL